MVSRRFVLFFALPLLTLGLSATLFMSRMYPATPNPRYEVWKAEIAAADSFYQELNYRDAEHRYRRALTLCAGDDGGDEDLMDPEVAVQTMSDLADAVSSQGRQGEALDLLAQALRIAERSRGRSSAEALSVLEGMRNVLQIVDFDSLTAACDARIDSVAASLQPMYRRAVEIQERRGRMGRLALAEKLVDLGDLYLTRGKPDRAEPLFARALEIRERRLGRAHGATVTTRFQLGLSALGLRKFTSAAEIFREIAGRIERESGPMSPHLLPVLDRLAEIDLQRGDPVSADSLYARALEIREEKLGKDHIGLTPTLSGLASAQLELGHAEDALVAERRALEIERAVYGKDHRRVGVHLMKVAEIEAKAGERSKARAACASALAILTETLGPNHELTVECRLTLEELMKPAPPEGEIPPAAPDEEDEDTAPAA